MSKILNHTAQKKSKQPERKESARFHPIRETTIKAARSHRHAASRGESSKEKPKQEAAQARWEDAVKQFALLRQVRDTNAQ